MSGSVSTGLVLSPDEARQRVRDLQSALDGHRDLIADLDLAIEDVLKELSDFEVHLQGRLGAEQSALGRVEALVRHLERWAELTEQANPEVLLRRGRRLESRRDAETAAQRAVREEAAGDGAGGSAPEAPEAAEAAEAEWEPVDADDPPPRTRRRPDREARLKTAFRALARRFHPDLARTERERVESGRMMARVNELYRLGDVARLEALAEQAKGGEVDVPDLDTDSQVELLEDRLAWYEAVLGNLRDERTRIEESPTCELMRRHEALQAAGQDLVEDMRERLRERWSETLRDVARAARELEESVSGYNHRYATVRALSPERRSGALERLFDPEGGQTLARLVLDELELDRADPAVRRAADGLVEAADGTPGRLRLVLLAWVSELSPFPLPGLGSWDEVAERFRHLGATDPRRTSLEQALAEHADEVEWGVRQATAQVVQVGLRLRDSTLTRAVPLALQRRAVRAAFRSVLRVLTERVQCDTCRIPIYPVALWRSRGIDDLRAVVCPRCGTTLSKYWMPKGDDVPSLLNQAYLDLEMVTEWGLRLGRSRIATQLVPAEVEAMDVGALKQRVHADLFERYELPVRRGQLRLMLEGRRVRESTPLDALDGTELEIAFTGDVEPSEAEAAELLRHRARHKFR